MTTIAQTTHTHTCKFGWPDLKHQVRIYVAKKNRIPTKSPSMYRITSISEYSLDQTCAYFKYVDVCVSFFSSRHCCCDSSAFIDHLLHSPLLEEKHSKEIAPAFITDSEMVKWKETTDGMSEWEKVRTAKEMFNEAIDCVACPFTSSLYSLLIDYNHICSICILMLPRNFCRSSAVTAASIECNCMAATDTCIIYWSARMGDMCTVYLAGPIV